MVAFQKLASGPVAVTDEIDAMLYLFSQQAIQQKVDTTFGTFVIYHLNDSLNLKSNFFVDNMRYWVD